MMSFCKQKASEINGTAHEVTTTRDKRTKKMVSIFTAQITMPHNKPRCHPTAQHTRNATEPYATSTSNMQTKRICDNTTQQLILCVDAEVAWYHAWT